MLSHNAAPAMSEMVTNEGGKIATEHCCPVRHTCSGSEKICIDFLHSTAQDGSFAGD